MTNQCRVLPLAATQDKTGCGRSFIYKAIKEGTFPKQIRLGTRRIGFLESEIDEWIDARVKESRSGLKEAVQ
jgi:prophage regulatory protein